MIGLLPFGRGNGTQQRILTGTLVNEALFRRLSPSCQEFILRGFVLNPDERWTIDDVCSMSEICEGIDVTIKMVEWRYSKTDE